MSDVEGAGAGAGQVARPAGRVEDVDGNVDGTLMATGAAGADAIMKSM